MDWSTLHRPALRPLGGRYWVGWGPRLPRRRIGSRPGGSPRLRSVTGEVMSIRAQNILSIVVAVTLAGINAVTAIDPTALGIGPIAVRWLGIVGIMLAALQPLLHQVTPARLKGEEG